MYKRQAQLFGNGEQGAMYIPQPQVLGQQVLYQDAAGTVPVMSDGDPVGYMQDLSGNGNHATQSTSASRPTYRTDGTLHWLEFDGVGDYFSTTKEFVFKFNAAAFVHNKSDSVFTAAESTSYTYTNAYLNGSLITHTFVGGGGIAVQNPYPLNQSVVYSNKFDGPSDVRINGAVAGSQSNLFAIPEQKIIIGARWSGSILQWFADGRLYGLVVSDDQYDDHIDIVVKVEQCLAKLSGVVL